MGLLLNYAHKNNNSNVIILPSKVKEQNSLYFDENNPVKDFLNDCCEITNNDKDRIKTRELYMKYIELENYKKIDEKKFSDLMCNLNKIKKIKSHGTFVYSGLIFNGLKNDENHES